MRRILEHLLKLDASPETDPRRGWIESVQSARSEIELLLEASASLRRTIDAVIAHQLPRACASVREVMEEYGEAPRVSLDTLSYDATAVLGLR